ncbi:hypothetical protein CEXT_660381 [Caerostris extrusa]|uniref:Uncharacterized protein n=1 Tax=Caerostris extrusa TaxID=172846 RepID=A0AAV4UGR4_CAEEX|nr:hypothetical protein CEXT_660381 [Caerostris extrusa]
MALLSGDAPYPLPSSLMTAIAHIGNGYLPTPEDKLLPPPTKKYIIPAMATYSVITYALCLRNAAILGA